MRSSSSVWSILRPDCRSSCCRPSAPSSEHAFTFGPNGKLVYNEWLYQCPKKSGKTTFAALIIITAILLYGGAYPEAFSLANDLEQSRSRVFEMCCRIVQHSPLLSREGIITQNKITFPAFAATIYAIASDAGSAAGSNAVVSCFDELWNYTSASARAACGMK